MSFASYSRSVYIVDHLNNRVFEAFIEDIHIDALDGINGRFFILEGIDNE